MTDAEKFRYGFLLRCADEGLDAAAADRRAAALFKQGNALGLLGAGALLAPPVLAFGVGHAAGQGLGRADNDYLAKETIEANETAAAYRRMAEKLRRQRAMALAGKAV